MSRLKVRGSSMSIPSAHLPSSIVKCLKACTWHKMCRTHISLVTSWSHKLSHWEPWELGWLRQILMDVAQIVLQTCKPSELYAEPSDFDAFWEPSLPRCMACSDNVVRGGLTPKFKDGLKTVVWNCQDRIVIVCVCVCGKLNQSWQDTADMWFCQVTLGPMLFAKVAVKKIEKKVCLHMSRCVDALTIVFCWCVLHRYYKLHPPLPHRTWMFYVRCWITKARSVMLHGVPGKDTIQICWKIVARWETITRGSMNSSCLSLAERITSWSAMDGMRRRIAE